MSASTGDKITNVRNGARPNSARVITARSVGGANIACNDLTGWPTASKVHFVTYQIDSNSNPIGGTQLDCSGIVVGATLTSVSILDGTDGGNSIGDVVEMLPTASWGQDLADALTVEHDRTGVHTSASAVTIGKLLYPIGSMYFNASDSTNPASLLGFGTWIAFGAGRVPVGVGTSDQTFAAGATGGESTHLLTGAESGTSAHGHTITDPGHHHQENVATAGGGGLTGITGTASLSGNTGASQDTSTVGTGVTVNNSSAANASSAHNILQPYVVVYIWKRTA